MPLACAPALGWCGVDAQIGAGNDGFEQLALTRNGCGQRQIATRQGVATPGFAETIDQRLVRGINKNELHRHGGAPQHGQDAGQLEEISLAIAGVDPHRNLTVVRQVAIANKLRKLRHETRREVVDAIKTRVFKRMQRRGFACARQTRDDDKSPRGHGGAQAGATWANGWEISPVVI